MSKKVFTISITDEDQAFLEKLEKDMDEIGMKFNRSAFISNLIKKKRLELLENDRNPN